MTTNIINKGNTRSEKGLYLAAQGHVRKIVPSTTRAQLYKVRSETDRDILYSVIQKSTGEVSCDCEDYMRRGVTCKHIYAVAFFMNPKVMAAKPERIDISGADF